MSDLDFKEGALAQVMDIGLSVEKFAGKGRYLNHRSVEPYIFSVI